MSSIELNGSGLSIGDVVAVARHDVGVYLCPKARLRMEESRAWVLSAARGDLVDESGAALPVYGVNTGYGSLARVRIDPERIRELSVNLIRSHAAGVGPALPREVVRAMMLLRANALAKGASGCQPELVETLLQMLEAGIAPEVPSRGSCGSSGDLAPLAHLGLIVFDCEDVPGDGSGHAWFEGARLEGREAMRRARITRLTPGPKDGLAMTNGAQLCAGLAALAVFDAEQVIVASEIAAAMSWESLRGVTRPLHPAVHELRPYVGATKCAENLRKIMEGSTLVDSLPEKVQDAYSLRCMPQVAGASRDGVAYAASQVAVEVNAVTDNPVILLDVEGDNKAYSAGLFHGEPVGMAADHLKLAVAEVASISERRVYRLTTGTLSAQLPPLLMRRDRPDMGLMVPQTTAASLVSENRALAYPSTADSIPTCEDQEDHVAMSTTACRLARQVVANTRLVVAIELLTSAHALRWRLDNDDDAVLGHGTQAAYDAVLPTLGLPDTTPGEQIEALAALIASGALQRAVVGRIGALNGVLRD